jgi:hypothetical protein
MFPLSSRAGSVIDRFAQLTHISTAVSLVMCIIMAMSGFLVFTDKTQVSPADLTLDLQSHELNFGPIIRPTSSTTFHKTTS